MLPAFRRLQALLDQTSQLSSYPGARRIPVAKMSVRISYYLPILLSILVAFRLSLYLQTGNASRITDWVAPDDKSGEFKRGQSAFRNFISREPGAEFPPEKDRYHLYISYACPWGMFSLHRIKLSNSFADLAFASPSYPDRQEAQRLGRYHILHQRALAYARER